jgi:hypothetical protein
MKKSEEILHKHIDKESMNELSENVWIDMIDAMEEYAIMRAGENSVSQHVSISLRDKLEEFVAKYWYDNEYQHIDKQDHEKATESRKKFRKWFDDNIDAFIKQRMLTVCI